MNKYYTIIRNNKEFSEISLDPSQKIFCDTETYLDEGKTKGGLYGKIRYIQLYQSGWETAYLIDCMFVDLQLILDTIQNTHLVFHNAAYDLHTINLHTKDLWLPTYLTDTLYLSRMKYYTQKKFDFYSCLKYAHTTDSNIKNMDKKASQKADWSKALIPKLLNYAAFDVIYLEKLYQDCCDKEDTEAYKLDIEILRYMIKVCRRGIPINKKKIKQHLGKVTQKLEKLYETLPVNPNSSKQCCAVLGTSSSDMNTLVMLKLQGNKLAGDIQDCRKLVKERTYLIKYNRDTLYGFINPYGAITGRISSTGGDRYDHDNIQQVPRKFHYCFEAPEGYTFIYKDYASLELRMAVVWVGEPTMEHLMRTGIDLHTHTGCTIFRTTEEDISKYQRMVGKILNFTLVYGAGAQTVQAMLRSWGGILMDLDEVKDLRKKWLEEYNYFTEWHKMTYRTLQVYGYLDVSTALGKVVRTYKANDALNTPIQGSAAEVTKIALKRLSEYPDEYVINTIHDSNLSLHKKEDKDLWIERYNKCMVDAWYYVIKDTAIPDLPMPAEAISMTSWKEY